MCYLAQSRPEKKNMLGSYSTRQAHGLGGPQWDCPTTSGDGEAEAAAFSRQGSTLPGGGLPPQPASASCRARDELAPRGDMLQLQVWLYDESPSHRFCFRVRGSEVALPSGLFTSAVLFCSSTIQQ